MSENENAPLGQLPPEQQKASTVGTYGADITSPSGTQAGPTDDSAAQAGANAVSTLSAVEESAAKFLAMNVPVKQVALALGVTQARVNQIAGMPAVKEKTAELAKAVVEQELERSRSLRSLEQNLILHIQTNAKYAEFKEQLGALKVVADIRTKDTTVTGGALATPGATGAAFNLNLVLAPQSADKLAYSTNSRGEIVTVDDKAMVSMPSAGVEGMMQAKIEEARARELEE